VSEKPPARSPTAASATVEKSNPEIAAGVSDVPVPARKPLPPIGGPSQTFEMAAVVPPPAAKPALQSPRAPDTPYSASSDEREAWVRAKYAVRAEEIKSFLELYPASQFVTEAQARLATLSRETLTQFNGTWRSFGPTGCAFTGVMELNQGAFTLTLKQPNASMWTTGEINEDGSIAKILKSSDNLVPSGRLPNLVVAPLGCHFELALVDAATPVRKTP
jgi:hypothetical protein